MSYESEMAKRIFALDFPITEDALKRAYREAAKELHPDRGGSSDSFKEMQKAYDFLTPFATSSRGTKLSYLFTVDGRAIATLGKGFPLAVPAVECLDCEGKGWVTRERIERTNPTKCIPCKYGWVRTMNGLRLGCKHCDGFGTVYTLVPGGIEAHGCPTCKGVGETRTVNAVLQRGTIR